MNILSFELNISASITYFKNCLMNRQPYSKLDYITCVAWASISSENNNIDTIAINHIH